MMRNVTLFVLTLSLGGAVALGGWWTMFLRDRFGAHEIELREKTERIAALNDEVAEKAQRIDELDEEVDQLESEVVRLETSLRLLKIDHRVAEIEVLEQAPDPAAPDETVTRILFTEFDVDGDPVYDPREIEVRGKSVYVETLIVKFDDDLIETGDPLRGSSICLFKRVYGENQQPTEGTTIDSVGSQPLVYGGDVLPHPAIQAIWRDFWDLANDPEAASERGVRAAHGEAPFIEVRPGGRYQLELRASGGLTMKPIR